jgi:hypothetical protein
MRNTAASGAPAAVGQGLSRWSQVFLGGIYGQESKVLEGGGMINTLCVLSIGSAEASNRFRDALLTRWSESRGLRGRSTESRILCGHGRDSVRHREVRDPCTVHSNTFYPQSNRGPGLVFGYFAISTRAHSSIAQSAMGAYPRLAAFREHEKENLSA